MVVFYIKNNTLFLPQEVLVYQSYTDENRFRMDGANVYVFNNAGSPILCGAIKINDFFTAEGQTYPIDCDLACGDGIIISVNRKFGMERCIHVYEVTATGYTYTGKIYILILRDFILFLMSTNQVSGENFKHNMQKKFTINFGINAANCTIPSWSFYSQT